MKEQQKEWEEFDSEFLVDELGFFSKPEATQIKAFINDNFLPKSELLRVIEGMSKPLVQKNGGLTKKHVQFIKALEAIKHKLHL